MLLFTLLGAETARYSLKGQLSYMPVSIGNAKAFLNPTSWEPNIPKLKVLNESHRKQHIRVHDFQLAPHMTPIDMRNLYVYDIIRLICEMLKSETHLNKPHWVKL